MIPDKEQTITFKEKIRENPIKPLQKDIQYNTMDRNIELDTNNVIGL